MSINKLHIDQLPGESESVILDAEQGAQAAVDIGAAAARLMVHEVPVASVTNGNKSNRNDFHPGGFAYPDSGFLDESS